MKLPLLHPNGDIQNVLFSILFSYTLNVVPLRMTEHVQLRTKQKTIDVSTSNADYET
jgi:hypothetical protein